MLSSIYLVFSESFKVLSEFWGILQDLEIFFFNSISSKSSKNLQVKQQVKHRIMQWLDQTKLIHFFFIQNANYRDCTERFSRCRSFDRVIQSLALIDRFRSCSPRHQTLGIIFAIRIRRIELTFSFVGQKFFCGEQSALDFLFWSLFRRSTDSFPIFGDDRFLRAFKSFQVFVKLVHIAATVFLNLA